MCGIAGIVERDQRKPISSERLLKMVRVLTHRGPDDEGYVGLPGVGLAMRRLAIVDVDGGHQPFKSEDGEIHLVANGEIYNHLELRKMLIAHGHCFRSESDIEVLVHAYEQWGTSFLERVHGMFAVALWDGRQRIFFAARDRAGEKPLYYAATHSTLIFASEIKGILASGMVERDVDLEALDQFLTYEYVITPRTIFSKIRRLPAAHYLVYRDGQLETCRYWDAAAVAPRHWKEDEAAEAVREVFAEAVSRQMMSDVPLGAFLSGGIDSSAVVAMMVEASGGDGSAVNTFSMGFADGSYNELPYARTVASRFKTTHREGTVEPDLRELFDQLIVHLDEPFADVSLFPTYMVSKMARQHVTVALSGDGGDELFGGYERYAVGRRIARFVDLMPRSVWRNLSKASNNIFAYLLDPLFSSLPKKYRWTGLTERGLALAGTKDCNLFDVYGYLISHWPAPDQLVYGVDEYPGLFYKEPPASLYSDYISAFQYIDLQFDILPILTLALFVNLLEIFNLFPQIIYRVQEKAKSYIYFVISKTFFQILAVLFFLEYLNLVFLDPGGMVFLTSVSSP